MYRNNYLLNHLISTYYSERVLDTRFTRLIRVAFRTTMCLVVILLLVCRTLLSHSVNTVIQDIPKRTIQLYQYI